MYIGTDRKKFWKSKTAYFVFLGVTISFTFKQVFSSEYYVRKSSLVPLLPGLLVTARLVRIFGTVVEFHGGIVNLPCADVRIPILPVIGLIIFGLLKCDLNIRFSKYFYGQTSSNFLAVKKLILYKNERMNNLTSFNLLSIKLVFLRNRINQIIVSWIEKSVAL